MNLQEEQTIYGLDSVLDEINGYEGKSVQELIDKNGNRDIWKLIKRGYQFDDKVLEQCSVSKEIRDERTYWEVVHKEQQKQTKTLKKDNASFDEIVESLSHVEVEDEEPKTEEEEEMEEFFENEDE